MEKVKSIFEISELIARDINGLLTQSEKEMLSEWLKKSDRNQKIYHQIINGNNLSERNRLYESVDVNQGWYKVSKSLNFDRKIRLIRLIVKYAAAILLPVLLGVTAHWYLNDQSKTVNQAIVEIKPGSKNAVLVMADGKSVDLAIVAEQSLVEHDGTVIKNTKDELNYKSRDLKNNKSVLYNTLIVPQGGEYNLILSDGSRIMVNSMSKLIFPVQFTGNIREVRLEEGEAYFEIAKNKSKPFIVSVKGVKVEVLGTSFNIKAYSNDNNFYTTLVEGKVKFQTGDQTVNQYYLEPDQQAVYSPLSDEVTIRKVDASQFVQWTIGRYSFTNESLDEIMKMLSRWYDFNYQYEDETLKQIRFEGGLNKYESIDPILDIISKTGKVHVKVQGKEIIFSRI